MNKRKKLITLNSLNVPFIRNFIATNYRNNLSWFADEIGVDRSYLALALKNKNSNKKYPSIILAIITFCINNNLEYKNFIFFSPSCSKKYLNKGGCLYENKE